MLDSSSTKLFLFLLRSKKKCQRNNAVLRDSSLLLFSETHFQFYIKLFFFKKENISEFPWMGHRFLAHALVMNSSASDWPCFLMLHFSSVLRISLASDTSVKSQAKSEQEIVMGLFQIMCYSLVGKNIYN